MKAGYGKVDIEKYGREIGQRREEIPTRKEGNMSDTTGKKECNNRGKDGKMDRKEYNKMNEGEEETERERESRMR